MLPGQQSVRCRGHLRAGKDVDHRGEGCKAITHNFAKFSFKGMKSGKSGPRGGRGMGDGGEGRALERQLYPTMGVDRD